LTANSNSLKNEFAEFIEGVATKHLNMILQLKKLISERLVSVSGQIEQIDESLKNATKQLKSACPVTPADKRLFDMVQK